MRTLRGVEVIDADAVAVALGGGGDIEEDPPGVSEGVGDASSAIERQIDNKASRETNAIVLFVMTSGVRDIWLFEGAEISGITTDSSTSLRMTSRC
jgi:hypothetical protein